MQITRPFHRVLVSAALGFSAACHDSTSPMPAVAFDARHALQRIDPLAAVLDQPIFRSFQGALSSFETFFRSTPQAVVIAVPSRGAFDLHLTRSFVPAAQIRASAIPDGVKGKTFVFDETSRTYVLDPTATGAPASGVRFILYTWDALNGPASPLQRIGRVDIFPAEGPGNGSELTEVVVFRETPFLVAADFITMHRTTGEVNTFGIEGSATDGFTVDVVDLNGTESGATGQHRLVYNTTLSSSPPGTSAVEQITSDQATASQSGRLELSYEGHKLTDESVSSGAEVKFDGNLYARVLFAATVDDQTQYLKPDGTPLSQQEVADLNAVLERAIVANFFWISLAFP